MSIPARVQERADALRELLHHHAHQYYVLDAPEIPDEALDQIGTDLEQLYDLLDARDLSAGSPQARRLFS